MLMAKKHRRFHYFLLLTSAYQFTLDYLFNIPPVDLRLYVAGKAPYPEQGRTLMALILRPVTSWEWLGAFVNHAYKEHLKIRWCLFTERLSLPRF